MAPLKLGFWILLALAIRASSHPILYPNFYEKSCPQALPTIKRVIEEAVQQERRMGASLLRLHFHDCFVNGCDGSILLDSSAEFMSEKFALANFRSARGFEVVDRIKSAVDEACGGPVVSCADILTVAARDSVVALGGPSWDVPLGRRDATFANITTANADIPPPILDLPQLIIAFNKQGLDVNDLVVLSGGHTLGFSQCLLFTVRTLFDFDVDPEFRRRLQDFCPFPNRSTNIFPFDTTPAKFDTKYFSNIMAEKGILHSDQQLFNGAQTRSLVAAYSKSTDAFAKAFAISMVKMGNIKVLTGEKGEIRRDCRKVN